MPFSLKGLPRVPIFVPRDQEINDLEQTLLPKPTHTIRQQVVVLHGPGGIGKTQLAIEFARRSQNVFSSIFWLNGSSRESIRQVSRRLLSSCPKIIFWIHAENFSKRLLKSWMISLNMFWSGSNKLRTIDGFSFSIMSIGIIPQG